MRQRLWMLGAIVLMTAVGCSSEVGGSAVPQASPGPASAPATSAPGPTPGLPAPPPAPNGRPTTAPFKPGDPPRALLLGLEELHHFIGGRLEYRVDTDQPLPETVDRPECGGVVNVPTAQVLSGSGYTAMQVQLVTDTRGSGGDVEQFAIEFPDGAAAEAFLVGQTDRWRSCDKQELSMTKDNTTTRWQVVTVNDANLSGGIVLPAVRELRPGPDGEVDPFDTSLYCGQTVSRVGKYVVGAQSCASGPNNGLIGSLLRARVPAE